MMPTQSRSGTMKAVVQEGSGSSDVLTVRDTPMPELTDDRVLVRVHATSVNALDYHTVHGGLILRIATKVTRQKPDPIRGVDVAGRVEAVGKNVTSLHPGDDVFGVAHGAWAEFASAAERGLAPKPARLSFAEAGAVGVAAFTALQAVRDHGRVGPGKRVLIYGAGGGVGTFAVQIAKALGAHVTAVTGPRNVELIRKLGAEEVVDYTKEDVLRRGERYDAIIDVAATRPLGALRRGLKDGGTLVMVGAAKKGGMLAIVGRIFAQVIRSRVLKQRVVMFVAKTRPDDL